MKKINHFCFCFQKSVEFLCPGSWKLSWLCLFGTTVVLAKAEGKVFNFEVIANLYSVPVSLILFTCLTFLFDLMLIVLLAND